MKKENLYKLDKTLYGFDVYVNLERKHTDMADWEKKEVINRIQQDMKNNL
jgi:hypothetical protein